MVPSASWTDRTYRVAAARVASSDLGKNFFLPPRVAGKLACGVPDGSHHNWSPGQAGQGDMTSNYQPWARVYAARHFTRARRGAVLLPAPAYLLLSS
jgi:hypothetical protein